MMRFVKIGLGIAVVTTPLAAQRSSRSLEGAWKVTEIVTTGADSSRVTSPQPGLLIFTRKHYSIMYVTGNAPRTPYKAANPTQEEKLAAFDSFVANTGTYEV